MLFMRAVRDRDLDRAKTALSLGARIDAVGAGGGTALAAAIAGRDFTWRTPARPGRVDHRARRLGSRARGARDHERRHAILDLLLDAGADPDRPVGGAIPLVFAAMSANPEMVKRLLEEGANPKAPDENGMTAGEFSSMIGQPEIASLLDGTTRRPGALSRSC